MLSLVSVFVRTTFVLLRKETEIVISDNLMQKQQEKQLAKVALTATSTAVTSVAIAMQTHLEGLLTKVAVPEVRLYCATADKVIKNENGSDDL